MAEADLQGTCNDIRLADLPISLHDSVTGEVIGTATVLDSHRLNVGEDIGGYRIARVRPESTREEGHVDVVKITEKS